MHYQRFRVKPETPVVLTTEQRFRAKFVVVEPSGCWEWQAARDKDGYGRFQYGPHGGQTRVRAHRWAYERWVEPIPPGLMVCHRCDNPPCCNPSHLFVGTGSDNKQDEIRKGRNNPPRGRRNPRAVLDEATVSRIRAMYIPREMSYTRIARLLNLNPGTVKNVVQGLNWRHVV